MAVFLEIRQLTKRYGRARGVEDVSFACAEGSFTVLLGPSGAGKTTTLHVVAGILQETSGEVLRRGESLRSVPPQRRGVSMVFEDYALYPTYSVYENIASPLRLRKVAAAELDRRVRDIARLIGIDAHLEKLPSQISGGQKQRTALARCLIRDADLYLLDEPIAHLDAKLRHRVRGELKRIHKDLGKTMVYVTHDYREALALADSVVILDEGKVVQVGSPDQVFNRPRNVFVATLLGEPPMNLVRLDEVRPTPDGAVIVAGGREVAVPGARGWPARRGVRLGFRHFAAALQAQPGPGCLEGTVYVSELMEDARVYSVKVGGDLVKVLTPRDVRYELNQRVYVQLDAGALYLFDSDSGERIEAEA